MHSSVSNMILNMAKEIKEYRDADKELQAKLARAVEVLSEALFMLTVPHLNYQPEPEEPGLRRIKAVLLELKGEKT